ncbi:MAG: DUF1761 domain-containing protein [Gemmatimonadota bacterium]
MYPIEINYVAVLVAALSVFALGALWYGPLFGKAWLASQVASTEDLEAASGSKAQTFGLSLAAYFVMALALGMFVFLINPPDLSRGLWLAAVVCVGFALPGTLTSVVYSANRMTLFWINGGYQVVSFLLMGAILTLWR